MVGSSQLSKIKSGQAEHEIRQVANGLAPFEHHITSRWCLAEPAGVMKADHEKLTKLVKLSGRARQ